MKSVYTKIVLWSFSSLLISLVAYVLVTQWITVRSRREIGLVPRFPAFILDETRRAYEAGGARDAAQFLARVNTALGVRHFVVDSQGRDITTGEDRSDLVRRGGTREGHGPSPEGIGVLTSTDGKYRLIVAGPPPFAFWRYVPYYGLILLAVAILCWPLAVNIGGPLRVLAGAVDRFGQGDLATRLRFSRRDEIGNLATSFDRMADRIETLLVAERRLLQDVSHELRSPLARLSFATELARTAPDRGAAIDRIKKEISRLSEVVATLIEVTRNEGDPSTVRPGTFALDELVRQVVEDCRLENGGDDHRIRLLRADSLSISGNREVMRRAIENVVRNAIYYSPPGSGVEVSLDSRSAGAHILVRDYGPGVPDNLLTEIFKPFFRVDDSRNGSTGGLGLGLTIASRAVHLHNGSIRAENADPGLMVEIDLPGTLLATQPAG
jgi:two-component system sensor histidine kinase CpxA